LGAKGGGEKFHRRGVSRREENVCNFTLVLGRGGGGMGEKTPRNISKKSNRDRSSTVSNKCEGVISRKGVYWKKRVDQPTLDAEKRGAR